MKARVIGLRLGEVVEERQGDKQSLVEWFDTEVGEGYELILIDDNGEVVGDLRNGDWPHENTLC